MSQELVEVISGIASLLAIIISIIAMVRFDRMKLRREITDLQMENDRLKAKIARMAWESDR